MSIDFKDQAGRGALASMDTPFPTADPWTTEALNEIYATYGDRVFLKHKSLSKFGRTTNADSGTKTTIATFGSVATVNVNETFVTTNVIDEVSSSNTNDTEIVTIEGHTIDGSGNLTFIAQDATLTGQTPVTLTTPMARCNRIYVKNGTFASPASDLVGDIYVYASDGVTVTAGVPQTSTAVKARIVAGKNQTEKCATSISSVDYWLLTGATVGINKDAGNTVTADFDIEVQERGGVWRPLGLELIARTSGDQKEIIRFEPYLIVPPNSDVRMVVVTNAADTVCTAVISGTLALIEA